MRLMVLLSLESGFTVVCAATGLPARRSRDGAKSAVPAQLLREAFAEEFFSGAIVVCFVEREFPCALR
jgi:hypothetical protein